MTYTYRSKSTPEQQAERDRQKLNRGLLLQRKDIADKSARIKALGGQLERMPGSPLHRNSHYCGWWSEPWAAGVSL